MGDAWMEKVRAETAVLSRARPAFPAAGADATRAAIREGLPGGPPPAAERLLLPRHAKHGAETAALLAGKTSDGLSIEVLKKTWSSLYVLAPEALRYYLPAFLLSAIGPDTDRRYLHSIGFLLSPKWIYSFYPDDLTTPPFGEAEIGAEGARAVSAFLELLFDCPGSLKWSTEVQVSQDSARRSFRNAEAQYRWLGAEGLYWRWNRQETPGLAKARAFIEGHFNASLPEIADPAARAVAEQIKAAFDAAPPPRLDQMTDSSIGDEPFEYAVKFLGRDWRRLSGEFLAWNYASLSFFAGEALRYFLPAYLIQDLAGAASNADPVLTLTHEDSRGRYSTFSEPEKKAVAAYLEFNIDRSAYGKDAIVAALNYWK